EDGEAAFTRPRVGLLQNATVSLLRGRQVTRWLTNFKLPATGLGRMLPVVGRGLCERGRLLTLIFALEAAALRGFFFMAQSCDDKRLAGRRCSLAAGEPGRREGSPPQLRSPCSPK